MVALYAPLSNAFHTHTHSQTTARSCHFHDMFTNDLTRIDGHTIISDSNTLQGLAETSLRLTRHYSTYKP